MWLHVLEGVAAWVILSPALGVCCGRFIALGER